MNRAERRSAARTKPKNIPHYGRKLPDRLVEHEVIMWVTPARAALARLIPLGSIDGYDFGAIQCLVLFVERICEAQGMTCPDTSHVRRLMNQMSAGMEVLEERVEKAAEWVDQAAAVLRKAPRSVVREVLAGINAQADSANGLQWEG